MRENVEFCRLIGQWCEDSRWTVGDCIRGESRTTLRSDGGVDSHSLVKCIILLVVDVKGRRASRLSGGG
jgi:hypothetical protein